MDLRMALGAAIGAAREAGALLRSELRRSEVDRELEAIAREADRLLRQRLGSAFPECAFADSAGQLHAAPHWTIDPIGGSISVLEGRGFAVSIALLVEAVPVLGVIFAPSLPDEAGELVAWAEGQPLLRDGIRHPRAELPERLERGSILLLDEAAERAPLASARASRPARFRGIDGIARRLALVATGEGDAAISFEAAPPAALAAGHALLRGVGGGLFDSEGRELRHPCEAMPVFAGSRALAATLAARNFADREERPTASALAGRFVPSRGLRRNPPPDSALVARAQGCLLGQLAGDSLGSLVEFRSPDAIAAAHPDGLRDLADGGTWNTLAGQPTDDSEMALLLARTLSATGDLDVASLRRTYQLWLESGPFDVGRTVRRGLRGATDEASEANGTLMRASPIGIFGHAFRPERIAALARADASITHPNPACGDASAALCIAIAHAIRHGDGAEAAWAAAWDWALGAHAHPCVVEALRAAREEAPEDYLRRAGWVRIALQNAFYQLLHAPSAEEGIIATVSRGGDSDTNAAIAGALLGAVHGREAIPLRWRRPILSCRALDPAFPMRPWPLWPVDALALAEELVAAAEGRAASRQEPLPPLLPLPEPVPKAAILGA